EAGQVMILPHNDWHLMGSRLDLRPVPTRELVQTSNGDGLAVISHGGGGEPTRIVCGFLRCDKLSRNPLPPALPPRLKFDAREGAAGSWIRTTLEFAASEVAQRRSGSEAVLAKMSELLFVEAVRRYVETMSDEQTGWLAGLKDPFISRALSLLHGRV